MKNNELSTIRENEIGFERKEFNNSNDDNSLMSYNSHLSLFIPNKVTNSTIIMRFVSIPP